MNISYSDRFQEKDAVEFYDAQEYGSGSYSTAIWQLQRPVIGRILKDFRRERTEPVRLLDFACGTGRVLASLEPLVDRAEGIDVSENMVAVARTKCVKARLLVGDILASPETAAKELRRHFLFPFSPERRTRSAEPGVAALARGVARAGRTVVGECPRQFAFAAASGHRLAAPA